MGQFIQLISNDSELHKGRGFQTVANEGSTRPTSQFSKGSVRKRIVVQKTCLAVSPEPAGETKLGQLTLGKEATKLIPSYFSGGLKPKLHSDRVNSGLGKRSL